MPTRVPYYQYDPYNPYPQLYLPQNQQNIQQNLPQNLPQNVQQSLPQNIHQQQTTQPQIQNGGFISIPSEQDARAFPVAPGTSVTFKNENAPYCYTKTRGFSQLEEPIFEIYRLEKESSTTEEKHEEPVHHEEFAFRKDLDAFKKDLDALTETVNTLVETVDSLCEEIDRLHEKRPRKKEVTQNDD